MHGTAVSKIPTRFTKQGINKIITGLGFVQVLMHLVLAAKE